MGITLVSIEKAHQIPPNQGVSLGELAKSGTAANLWIAAFGWDPAQVGASLDCDLWMALLKNGRLIEEVHYNATNAKAKVVSASGALTYNGDDLTGDSSDGGDDETGTIDLAKARAAGADEVLIIGSVYTDGKTFADVVNGYGRVFPDGAGDDTEQVAVTRLDTLGAARAAIIGRLKLSGGDAIYANDTATAGSIGELLAPFQG